MVALCLLLAVGGGWMTLASRGGQSGATTAEPSPRELPSSAPPPFADSAVGLDLGRGELFFKMMLSVGVVLALGAAALVLSKRVLPRMAHAPGKEIHILETAYLGPRKALHLLEVGGQRLLIASTSENVTMLAALHETWLDVPGTEPQEAGKP